MRNWGSLTGDVTVTASTGTDRSGSREPSGLVAGVPR